jgi:cell division transport system permease protein
MMQILVQQSTLLRTAWQRMFASPLAGLLNILVIGIALGLPAGMYVLLQNAQGLVNKLSGTPQISLFLSMDAKVDDIDKLRKLLAQNPAIDKLTFVSREQALEQLRQSSGLSDVIGSLNQNPLPDGFIITPKQSQATALDVLRDELAKLPEVEQVQLDSAWAYKLEALLKFGRLGVLILASLLSLALLAITFNTIRLQILTHRDEIEVSRLIGATNGFIRRPFLYFGALQGLLGGVMAWLIISVSLLLLNWQVSTLARLYSSQFTLHSLSPGDSFALLIFSLYLGWLGAWLSVGQHLSKSRPQ